MSAEGSSECRLHPCHALRSIYGGDADRKSGDRRGWPRARRPRAAACGAESPLAPQAEAAKDAAEQALGLVAGAGPDGDAAADSKRAASTADAAGEVGAVSLDSDKEDVGADAERDVVAKVLRAASRRCRLGRAACRVVRGVAWWRMRPLRHGELDGE